MYNNQEIALKIKQIAKNRKVSIKQLLEDCNLNVNYISQFANGRDMTVGNLYLIANYLGVSVDYLLGRTDNPDIHSDSSIVVTREYTENFLDEFFEEFKKLGINQKIKVMNYAVQLSEEN